MANSKRKGTDLEGAPPKKPLQDSSLDGRPDLRNEAPHLEQHGLINKVVLTNGTTSSASTSAEELMSIARQACRQVEETVASGADVNPRQSNHFQGDVDVAIERVNQEISHAESRVLLHFRASLQRATKDLVYIYTRGSQAISDISRGTPGGNRGVAGDVAGLGQTEAPRDICEQAILGSARDNQPGTSGASSTLAGTTTSIRQRNAAGHIPLPTSPIKGPRDLPFTPANGARRVCTNCNGRRLIALFTRRRAENAPLRDDWISCNVCSLRFRNRNSREIMSRAEFDRKFGA